MSDKYDSYDAAMQRDLDDEVERELEDEEYISNDEHGAELLEISRLERADRDSG